MRHAKSCSNMLRDEGLVTESKQLRDPSLSCVGRSIAAAYAPHIRSVLNKHGLRVNDALVGSSTLQRAKETAAILFPASASRRQLFPCFTENGNIPENTPKGKPYRAPSWTAFVEHLSTLDSPNIIVVGHGSFIRDTVWPAVTGKGKKARLNNLDGLLIDCDIEAKGLHVHSYEEICYHDHAKLSGHSRMVRKTQKQKQRGGGVNMPLSYFLNGAQMRGTFGEPTGPTSAPSGPWVRPPLTQTGGFSPSIMGGFAVNGLKLAPIAAYMMYKNRSQDQKKTRKRKTRKTRH